MEKEIKERIERFERWTRQGEVDVLNMIAEKQKTSSESLFVGLYAIIRRAYEMGVLAGKGCPEDTFTYSCAVQELSNEISYFVDDVFHIDPEDWNRWAEEHPSKEAILYENA